MPFDIARREIHNETTLHDTSAHDSHDLTQNQHNSYDNNSRLTYTFSPVTTSTYNHTVNPAQNMSLLAATMAMNVAIPVLNTLITKAINRWNDDIPLEMTTQARDEYKHLCGKVSKVIEGAGAKVSFSLEEGDSLTANDFLKVQIEMNRFFSDYYKTSAYCILSGIIRQNEGKVLEGETMMKMIGKHMSTSIETSRLFGYHKPGSSSFKYDQSIDCLSRIHPSKKLCSRGSFMLRNLETITHMGVSASDLKVMISRLSDIYIIAHKKLNKGKTYIVTLSPVVSNLTASSLSNVYGMDLNKLTMSEFFGSKTNEWWIEQDNNLSKRAIMKSMVGHSLSVLGEVIDEARKYIISLVAEMEPDTSLESIFLDCDSGPWNTKNLKTRFFSDPLTLYGDVTEQGRIKLNKDFKIMESMIIMRGLHESLFPTMRFRNYGFVEEHVYNTTTILDGQQSNKVNPMFKKHDFVHSDGDSSTLNDDADNELYPFSRLENQRGKPENPTAPDQTETGSIQPDDDKVFMRRSCPHSCLAIVTRYFANDESLSVETIYPGYTKSVMSKAADSKIEGYVCVMLSSNSLVNHLMVVKPKKLSDKLIESVDQKGCVEIAMIPEWGVFKDTEKCYVLTPKVFFTGGGILNLRGKIFEGTSDIMNSYLNNMTASDIRLKTEIEMERRRKNDQESLEVIQKIEQAEEEWKELSEIASSQGEITDQKVWDKYKIQYVKTVVGTSHLSNNHDDCLRSVFKLLFRVEIGMNVHRICDIPDDLTSVMISEFMKSDVLRKQCVKISLLSMNSKLNHIQLDDNCNLGIETFDEHTGLVSTVVNLFELLTRPNFEQTRRFKFFADQIGMVNFQSYADILKEDKQLIIKVKDEYVERAKEDMKFSSWLASRMIVDCVRTGRAWREIVIDFGFVRINCDDSIGSRSTYSTLIAVMSQYNSKTVSDDLKIDELVTITERTKTGEIVIVMTMKIRDKNNIKRNVMDYIHVETDFTALFDDDYSMVSEVDNFVNNIGVTGEFSYMNNRKNSELFRLGIDPFKALKNLKQNGFIHRFT